MAEERGWFDFADVAEAIRDKLTRRHPHIFAGADLAAEDLVRVWEEQKAQERAAEAPRGPGTVLSGVPRALPALARATKLGKRAARVGFDWPQARDVRAKVLEELGEVDEAVEAAAAPGAPGECQARVAEEIGDLLFSVANWSRHLGVDPEEALRTAGAKFEQRFLHMEQLAQQRGQDLQALSGAQWDELWRAAKLNGS